MEKSQIIKIFLQMSFYNSKISDLQIHCNTET